MKIAVSLFAFIGFVVIGGCASSTQTAQSPGSQVKPIDRVRSGIADVAGDLRKTQSSLRDLENQSGPFDRGRRAAFSDNLQSTEQRIATLRTDAKELRERAAEYLTLWTGQVVTVGSDYYGYRSDAKHDVRRDKYDAFVATLVSARDTVV